MRLLPLSKYSTGLLAGVLAFTGLLAGCGGGGGGSSSDTSSRGVTSIYLTDAPLTGAEAVTVTIDKIEARLHGGSGSDDSGDESRPGGDDDRPGGGNNGGGGQERRFVDTGIAPVANVNLLALKNAETLLGSVKLAPGEYAGLRLTISNATITVNGTVFPLVPVSGRGGAKGPHQHAADTAPAPDARTATLLIKTPFTVAADGAATSLLLDFNVARSVVALGNGQYLLKPVIVLTPRNTAASLRGTVTLTPPPPAGATIPEVSVSAIPSGQAAAALAAGTPPEQIEENGCIADDGSRGGAFQVKALRPGTYDVTITAVGYAPVTLPGVAVQAGQRLDLGNIVLNRL